MDPNRYIYGDGGWRYNLAYEFLGHIGGVDTDRAGGFQEASLKILENLGVNHEYIPYPCRNIYDALESIDTLIPRGRTAYIHTWNHLEREFLERHYRPYVEYPLINGKPDHTFLDLHFEYDGTYLISIPDRVTGEVYIDLLRKIVESILDKGGIAVLDLTHIPYSFREVGNIHKTLEPIWGNTFIYISFNESLTTPGITTGCLYIPIELDDEIKIKPWDHRHIVDRTGGELHVINAVWSSYLERVNNILEERRRIASKKGFKIHGNRGYLEVRDVNAIHSLLTGLGILTLPVESLGRIYISLTTDTSFKEAIEKVEDVLEEGAEGDNS